MAKLYISVVEGKIKTFVIEREKKLLAGKYLSWGEIGFSNLTNYFSTYILDKEVNQFEGLHFQSDYIYDYLMNNFPELFL